MDRQKTAFFIETDSIGRHDRELGEKLMLGFLRSLLDADSKPWRIMLINAGVNLATKDDTAVELLQMLGDAGVEVLSCGTCLDQYGLADRLRAGRRTTMPDTVAAMAEAGKVVTIA